MANLIKPDRRQHEYVIGIDFGHGETSAAICELQWDVPDGKSNIDAADIRINPENTGNETVIVSAISIRDDSELAFIGENAFGQESMTKNTKVRVCFKEAPQPLTEANRGQYDEQEWLMLSFMKIVYKTIRKIETARLKDGNHLVYLARPSGWEEPMVMERYCEMAIDAGIPLAGLTSESRAAIFYAINSPKIQFAQEVENGAIVFDLGSSTLDLTYLKRGEAPIDYGYRTCGASKVERVIYDEKMAVCSGVHRLLEFHPEYEAKLLFKAREIKEEIYKRQPGMSIDESFLLRTLISKDCTDYDSIKKEFVEIEYKNVDAFNDTLEAHADYKSNLKKALIDYKEHHIPGKDIHGVFLTGGASRMRFVLEIVKDTYQLDENQVRVDPDNPSLTISRGIAMLGRADCLTNEVIEQLLSSITDDNINAIYESIIKMVQTRISDGSWIAVKTQIEAFAESETNMSLNDLFYSIECSLEAYLQDNVETVFKEAINYYVNDKCKELSKKLQEAVYVYAPGADLLSARNSQISLTHSQMFSNVDDLLKSIMKGFNLKTLYVLLLAALTVYFWPLTVVLVLAEFFGGRQRLEDRAKSICLPRFVRRRCRARLLENPISFVEDMRSAVRQCVSDNSQISSLTKSEIRKLLTQYINDNVAHYKIHLK